MTTAVALLQQAPAAFWLAVAGVLMAAAVASGRPVALIAGLAAGLGAVMAAVAPGAIWAQAGATAIGVAAVSAWALVRRGRARARPSPAPAAAGPGAHDDTRLLGRTARTRAPFVAGQGEVEVDGRPRPARALKPDEFLGGDVLVRIVRVGRPELGVRPLALPAD